MIIEYDVVVAAAGSCRKTPHVISVELADGFDSDMELSGFGVWGRGILHGGQGGIGFGGPYPLSSMG